MHAPDDVKRGSLMSPQSRKRSAGSFFTLACAITLAYGTLAPTLANAAAPAATTKLGKNALKYNTGANNTAIGFYTMNPNYFCTAIGVPNPCCIGAQKGTCGTSGTNNTAVGAGALTSMTSGGSNTALGDSALLSNSTGRQNVAVGSEALFASTNSDNTAVGSAALRNTTTGNINTAVGKGALVANTIGQANTGLGVNALFNNTTGRGNTAIGSYAGYNLTTGNFNIYIRNDGVAEESDTIRIGTYQTATYIAGISGATSADGVAVFVDGAGHLGTITSSARFKEGIEDIGDGSSALMKLRPVRFHYKQDVDPSGIEQYGLVAEEVAKVYPDLVVYDEKGEPQTVRYHFVNALLLNEVQRQARRAEAQEREIEAQRQKNDALAAEVRRMTAEARKIDALAARLVELEKALGAGPAAPMPVPAAVNPG